MPNGRIQKLQSNQKGYLRARYITKEGKRESSVVQRLVAMAFIPIKPGKDQVNHKNGIKTNNRVDNLEWVSQSENMSHRIDVLGIKSWEKCPLNKKKVICLDTGEVYQSCAEAGRCNGIHPTSIAQVCRGCSNKSFREGEWKQYQHKTAGGKRWAFI